MKAVIFNGAADHDRIINAVKRSLKGLVAYLVRMRITRQALWKNHLEKFSLDFDPFWIWGRAASFLPVEILNLSFAD